MDVPLGLSCVMARLGKEAGERVAEGGGQSVWFRNLSLALKSSGSFSFLIVVSSQVSKILQICCQRGGVWVIGGLGSETHRG